MLKFEQWMQNVTIEDLPNDDLRFIGYQAGLKSALILILLSPGVNVSIPKNALRLVKERYIVNKHDGTRFSINKLAVECNLSQRQVYRIIQNNLKNPTTK